MTTILFALGLVVWLAGVLPMTGVPATWPTDLAPGQLPGDFERVSRQWEFGHAAVAILKLAGFMVLVASLSYSGVQPAKVKTSMGSASLNSGR